MSRALVFGCLWVLVGCSGLSADDPGATQAVELTAYASEATALVNALAAQSTEVVQTYTAAQTYVAYVDGVNRQIVATMRAVNPPTPQVVQPLDPSLPVGTIAPPDLVGLATANAVMGATPMPMSSGMVEFAQPMQTALSVRSSDGCAESLSSQFTTSSPQIYATARLLNVRSGTTMGVEWLAEGQVVYQFSFTVDADDPDYCVWFSITPQDVPFTPGAWSVRLLINGAPTPAYNFTIVS